jgi:hypothetical protein
MANALYPAYKAALGAESHHMTSDSWRAILVDLADYTYNAAHDFLDDIASGARVAVATLASLTFAGGVFDSADFAWTAVTGDQCEAVVLYNHDGAGAASDAARQLGAFYDTGMTGMPVTPSGGDINFAVHSSGWFAL